MVMLIIVTEWLLVLILYDEKRCFPGNSRPDEKGNN